MIDPDGQADVQNAFEWQMKRRRPDGLFGVPTQGFGGFAFPMTLWLPSSRAETRYVTRDGRSAREAVPNHMSDPALSAARAEILVTYVAEDSTAEQRFLASVDLKFRDYAIALLVRNYTLSDEEVDRLLTGTGWHISVWQHLLSGDDIVAAVSAIVRPPRSTPPVPALPAPTPPAPTHRSFFSRILKR